MQTDLLNNEKIPNKLRRELQDCAEYMHSGDSALSVHNILEMVFIFILAALVAFSINSFLFQIIRVDGISMEPTFYTGERVFAEKISYKFSEPKHNHVVICRYELGNGEEQSDRVIKRVIALPGETVEIINGAIYVNNEKIDESGYWSDIIYSDMEQVTVPEDHYFVVGDNRNHSWDSRDPYVGAVPSENLIGHVLFVVWPFKSFGAFPS